MRRDTSRAPGSMVCNLFFISFYPTNVYLMKRLRRHVEREDRKKEIDELTESSSLAANTSQVSTTSVKFQPHLLPEFCALLFATQHVQLIIEPELSLHQLLNPFFPQQHHRPLCNQNHFLVSKQFKPDLVRILFFLLQ